ncbi:MAG: ATP-binding cassette domain-containing protein [Actinomycetia bacterium]|nr:ATP-binding cassette domain-containing protein [Actinomycetes bacterium]
MLSVRNISKRYGEVVAMRDVSFDVHPGRILGFLGRNGAGKTTTMRSIFKLVQPDSGDVTYNGQPIDLARLVRFGYMPEERGLYPRMKVRDQLVYLASLSGMSSRDAGASTDMWLERLGLGDRADAKLEDLSHGNQQRVQMAAAIIHDPDLLVLDEPFSGLDPIGVDSMSEVIREFASKGAGILFSSHQLDLVEHICEDVAIIDQGEVILIGDLNEIREEASYRRVLIEVDGQLWTPPVSGAHEVGTGGKRHHIVDASVDVEQLLRLARDAGSITRFSYETPALSDIFQEAVVK